MVEMLPEYLDVIDGKVHRFNDLYLMRQSGMNHSSNKKFTEKNGGILERLSFGNFSHDLKKWIQIISERISGLARQKLGKELNLIDSKKFEFCWITDYPMYQFDEKEKKIDFSHNPFSMPQVDIKSFDKTDPLSILAYQYDLVCNGYELSSGAIRNHLPDLMYKVFSKVGYSKEQVNSKFEGMIKALSYGAPPHGGMAPGIDRIVMLLADKVNIREVTLFPMNQNAQDLLMGAPSSLSDDQLKELSIKVLEKKK